MISLKTLSQYYDFARRHASGFPLFGPLAYCGWAEHKSAAREMVVVASFATATFWLTALLLMSSQAARSIGYSGALLSTVKSGELFIFAVGFLGPILLTALDDPKEAKEFPGRMWHIFVLVIVGFVATGFHAQIKAAQLKGPLDPMDQNFLFDVSVFIAGAAVVLRYLAIVYRKSTFVPEDEIKTPETDFADSYVRQHQNEPGP
jgi:hypothetical protein